MTYFVNMSTMLSKVPILWTDRMPLCTSCCMNCVLDPKWIVAPRYLIAKPVVDFLVVVQPAQSAST